MSSAPATYRNPVYNRSFPDPFVLKFAGIYYAFSTGRSSDGRVFGMLRSEDLVSWVELAGAMAPLEHDHPCYWAPEVTYSNGRFYLYYSVGNEKLMEIRVAISDRPDGDYVDAGRTLTTEEFAIDAHVIRDDDGAWYMFYATDFFEHTHIGTGIVVDRMLDPYTLEGKPRPVTRAKFDWQIYDAARKEKGGVRWHTVEGPFVLKRKGLYYEMFSGGNWQNISYGVSYAVSNTILADEEWEQFSDGVQTLPILRTIPGDVIGPGHNCVVVGPNGRDLYCIYHCWSNGERVLAIDRMDYAGGRRLFIVGPTSSPQPAPNRSPPAALRQGRLMTGESFLCEITFRNTGRIDLVGDNGRILLVLDVRAAGLAIRGADAAGQELLFTAPEDFTVEAVHTITLEVDRRQAAVVLDGRNIELHTVLAQSVTAVEIEEHRQMEILSLTLTPGFEDRFEDSINDNAALARGWKWAGDHRPTFGEAGILILNNVSIWREALAASFELAVNFRLAAILGDAPSLALKCGREFLLHLSAAQVLSADWVADLPTGFEPTTFHQIRFVSDGRTAEVWLNEMSLGEVVGCPSRGIEIVARDAVVEVDMVRFTVH